jgi:acyl-CoA thioesterase
MGDLAVDAAVSGGDGRYHAKLSPEWAAWGPNGGYVAAILLNAAKAHGGFPRAASISCHFLSVGGFADVQVETETLRRTRRAESVRARMVQDGSLVAEALVWLVADELDGLRHDAARMPDVPDPDTLRTFEELAAETEGMPDESPPMWQNIEGKPTVWYSDQAERPVGEPYASGWYRFPAHTTDDCARQLVLLDVMAWTAAWNAYPPDNPYMAPNMDLNVQFHRPDGEQEWLLAEGFADVAEDGLIGFRTKVWSRPGRLLATGSGQLLCRRI